MTTVDSEPEPPIARAFFGERIDVIRSFVSNLERFGQPRGLIGPSEVPRLWSRHILNSAFVSPVLRGGLIGDIGSGAGLPGIVLAIARPDCDFVLIEPTGRRIAWLEEQVELLELRNVRLVRARAQETVLDQPLDQVTARAVTSLAKLIPLAVPLLRTGGEILFIKGASVNAEISAAEKIIRRFQLRGIEVLSLGQGLVSEATQVVRAKVE